MGVLLLFSDVWIDIDVANYFVTSSSGNGIKVIVHDHRVYPRINEQGTTNKIQYYITKKETKFQNAILIV